MAICAFAGFSLINEIATSTWNGGRDELFGTPTCTPVESTDTELTYCCHSCDAKTGVVGGTVFGVYLAQNYQVLSVRVFFLRVIFFGSTPLPTNGTSPCLQVTNVSVFLENAAKRLKDEAEKYKKPGST